MESVNVRRSESADAQGISSLICPATVAVFGQVDVMQLLEKANLAVTVVDHRDHILAHASFLDHPVGDVVDAADWESFLQERFRAESCTPLNTLFLHLFVTRSDFAAAGVREILRVVFNSVSELEHLLLISSHHGPLEPALTDTFQPLQPLSSDVQPQCLSFICDRQQHCPRLRLLQARMKDHDGVMSLFDQQRAVLSVSGEVASLTELMQNQDERNHTAVCQVDGVVVGLISATSDVDLKELCDNFELEEFNGLQKKTQATKNSEAAAEEEEEEEKEEEGEEEEEGGRFSSQEETEEKPDVFWIKFLLLDSKYEMRSVDLLPYVFQLFPDLDFCVITAPTLSPDFSLLQSFFRARRRPDCSLLYQLYVFHRVGLRPVQVRAAVPEDRPAVCDLVQGQETSESLLQDLDAVFQNHGDLEGVQRQAFVAQVDSQLVGALILRDEENVEFVRAHYNIENFIYFSHHRPDEHAHLLHFTLRPLLQHRSRHLLKETLRLAKRSCLYHRLYQQGEQAPGCEAGLNSSVVKSSSSLELLLDRAVPVRPRRQIVYPLKELGINAPSTRITEEQTPFALCLISRKLTLEPKVMVTAQVVVVGASDTGLSFLEVLCTCPHLRFCTLTLVSTHGFPTRSSHQDPGFLSTSHAHSSTDLALLPLRSCVTVVTEKMVKIDRKSKRVLVSSGRKVPYDFLLLCPGLQYQMPSRAGSGSSQTPPTRRWRHPGPAPSNLFTLNAPQDCDALRRWLLQNFVERQEDAVVYGNSLDVYTTVGALLGLGVRGSRIHLVLTPPGNTGASCFGDRVVDRAVASELERAEVRVHSDFVLTRINDGDHHLDPVTSATFSRDDSKDLRLLCGLFINLSNRGVDYDAFRAVSTSFLTFDSRIVIDAQFGTNDPAIFAAGPATKFCRRYHTDEWEHGSFNSKEVGRNLADRILGIIDPTWELDHRPPADQRLVPLYREAKIQGGTLPGGHHYLHFRKPSPSEPPAWTAPHVGPPSEERVMVTGGVETGNYFCLHLDIHQQVETLTCFSRKPFPVSNYLSLYGKHQQLLGRLLTRYHQNQVQDLYSFFTHSSCLPVFHDRFSDLQQELQQMNADKEAGSQQQLGDDDDALRRRAVKYLKYNRNLLPMFACRPQL